VYIASLVGEAGIGGVEYLGIPCLTRASIPGRNWDSITLEMTSIIATPSLRIENPGIRWVEGLERVLSPALLLLFLQAARNAARD